MAQEAASRKPFIGGNWKCTQTRETSTNLAKGLKDLQKNGGIDLKLVDVLVAPIAIHIDLVNNLLNSDQKEEGIVVSSQNCSATNVGAFTGEIAPEQLKDFGINWTIIGHSERRKYYNEDDKVITTKVKNALANGLNIIACFGETLEEREAGLARNVCERQLKLIMAGIPKSEYGSVVLAYEPVWAIGTGKTCPSDEAQNMCAYVRSILDTQQDDKGNKVGSYVRVLYGGSVKKKNAAELIAQKDIDGFLVGGASLDAAHFGEIIGHVQKSLQS